MSFEPYDGEGNDRGNQGRDGAGSSAIEPLGLFQILKLGRDVRKTNVVLRRVRSHNGCECVELPLDIPQLMINLIHAGWVVAHCVQSFL